MATNKNFIIKNGLTVGSTEIIDSSGNVDGRDVSADGSKLDGIAAGATNVSSLTDLSISDGTNGQVLTTDGSGNFSFQNASGGVSDIVDDTTPQLGGNLDTNGNDITFGDNDKAIFGAGSDLEIYHSGTHSYIKDSGTGNLYLGGSDLIWLGSGDLQETYATFNDDGAVNLYHNNSIKLATTATGIDVTGGLKISTGGTGLAIDSSSNAYMVIDRGASNRRGELVFSTASTNVLNAPPLSATADWALGVSDSDELAGDAFYIATASGAGNAKMVITQSGQVGIGTTSPDANSQLHIKKTGANAKITLETDESNDCYINFSGATSEASIGYEPTSNAIVFANAADGLTSNERMRIDSSGVVTIGGNTAWHAGNDGSGSGLDADLLDGIQGSSFLRSDADDSTTGGLRVISGSIASTDTSKGLLFDAQYTNGQYRTRFRKQDKGGGVPLYIDASGSTANSYTELARFGAYSGNGYELEVFGDINATGNLYDGGNAVWHAGNDGSGSGLDADLLDGHHKTDLQNNKRTSFYVAGQADRFYKVSINVAQVDGLRVYRYFSETIGGTSTYWNSGSSTHFGALSLDLRILRNDWGGHRSRLTGTCSHNYTTICARAGMGQSSEHTKVILYLRGGAGGSGAIYHLTADSHTASVSVDYNSYLTAADAEFNYNYLNRHINPHNLDYYNIHAAGSITANGNITAYASDERLKENIETISNALDKVSKLRGVTYDWKDDCVDKGFTPAMKHETGVIAQEVQAVIPDATAPAPFDGDYLTVRHEKIIPVLIEAIKELKAEIEELKEK